MEGKLIVYKKLFCYLVVVIIVCIASALTLLLFPITANAAGETVYVYQDITTNTTWNSGNTYVICEVPGTSRGPQVIPGVTLTIESGATVLLDDNRVYIEGGINTYTHGNHVCIWYYQRNRCHFYRTDG